MTTVNYKGIDLHNNETTGMTSATVIVNWSVFDTDQRKYNIGQKEEKLFGRPKDVKNWIDNGLKNGMIVIN